MGRDVGQCIYCGAQGPDVRLTKEHIIPASLDAGVYLKNASCDDCAKITTDFELHVARNIFGHHRIHKGTKTRRPKKRPPSLPAKVVMKGVEHYRNLDIKDHPYFLAMPIWDQPGMLRGVRPNTEYPGLSTHLFWHIPDNIKETLGLSDGEVAELRPDSQIDANQFGRAIAKIAYCSAINNLGLDGIAHSDLPAVILGKDPNIPFFVGSVLRPPPPPERDGALHRTDLGTTPFILDPRSGLYRRFLVANIRLFRPDGVADHGMPVYTVIVGSEA